MEHAIAEICRILYLAIRRGNGWMPALYKDYIEGSCEILGITKQPPDQHGVGRLACRVERLEAYAAKAGLDLQTGDVLDMRKFREAIIHANKGQKERRERKRARHEAYRKTHAQTTIS
jgi:hypothetical protein